MSLAERRTRVLVIDADRDARMSLVAGLEPHGFAVEVAGSERDAVLRLLEGRFQAGVVVHRAGGLDVERALDTLWNCDVRIPFVVLDLERSFDLAARLSALRAPGRAAYRLVGPPPDEPFEPGALAAALSDRVPYPADNARLDASRLGAVSGLVGRSSAMMELVTEIRRVAPSRMDVLITGETGVGKTQVARAVHDLSPRAQGPFVAMDCTYLGQDVAHAQSNLFGHVRGAYTGAVGPRAGRVVEAEGGTLFLDEIGEIPLEAQRWLLRLLQERRFQPLGSDVERTADVRIIAATNKDLSAEVEAGRFRADLYSRLTRYPIHVPALRERPADIPDLVQHLRERLLAAGETHVPDFSRRAIQRLQEEDWPANVRDLFNVVERTITSVADQGVEVIQERHLRFLTRMESRRDASLRLLRVQLAEATSPVTRRALIASMSETGRNKSRAARILGISRARLNMLLRLHGLEGYFLPDDLTAGGAAAPPTRTGRRTAIPGGRNRTDPDEDSPYRGNGNPRPGRRLA